MEKLFYILIYSLISFNLFSQELTVSVDKNPANVGEQLLVTFKINKKAKNFQSPKFNGLRVLSGPNPSSYSNHSIINGKRESTFTNSYSFYIQTINPGNYTITPASVTVDGSIISSKPINIVVNKNSKGSKKTKSNIARNNLFINVNVSKKEIYQGEQILVTYKLYTRLNLANTEIESLPSLNGFWKKDLETSSRFKQENLNGTLYNVATIKKTVLTAQKVGELIIDPMEIRCSVHIQNQKNRRDPFSSFFNTYSTKKELISSKTISIKVKELPTSSITNFKGAVGQMNIAASVDNTTIKANEAINYKIQITGKGNLELIDKVDVLFPTDFDVYDPKVNERIFEGGRKRSIKTFEYVLIPRYEGEYTIPETKLIFFDPKTESYKTVSSKAIIINIEKGTETGSSSITGNRNQQNIKQINTDIRFIKTEVSSRNSNYLDFKIFYIVFFLPILIILIIIVLRKINSNRLIDESWKTKKAKKIAQKRLDIAERYMKNNNIDNFFEEVEKSIWGYFSYKFDVQVASLSKETIHEHFRILNISEKTEKEFIQLLDDCEFSRYTPSNKQDEEMSRVLEKAKKIIIDVESIIK